jgi:hypothetical protein
LWFSQWWFYLLGHNAAQSIRQHFGGTEPFLFPASFGFLLAIFFDPEYVALKCQFTFSRLCNVILQKILSVGFFSALEETVCLM